MGKTIKERVLEESLKETNLSEEQKKLIVFSERIGGVINQTLNHVCRLIEKDINFQKNYLKEEKEFFERNKPFNWRIAGFKALLSKLKDEINDDKTLKQKERKK